MDESSTETTKEGFTLTVPLLLFALLIILILGFILFGYHNKKIVDSRDPDELQSPFCLKPNCIKGNKRIDYELSTKDQTYETINYCTVNAPPSSFVHELEACASGKSSGTLIPQKIIEFAAFYNKFYVDSCGFSWKNAPVQFPNPSNTPSESKKIAKALKTPQPDRVIKALVGCAKTLKIDNNSDIKELEAKLNKISK